MAVLVIIDLGSLEFDFIDTNVFSELTHLFNLVLIGPNHQHLKHDMWCSRTGFLFGLKHGHG